MGSVTIRGPVGEMRWGYRPAASLSNWTVRSDGPRCTLTATVVSQDAYAVTQQPLTFRVPRETGPDWIWSIESLQMVGSALTASLRSEDS